jgi:hypothetical protein
MKIHWGQKGKETNEKKGKIFYETKSQLLLKN